MRMCRIGFCMGWRAASPQHSRAKTQDNSKKYMRLAVDALQANRDAVYAALAMKNALMYSTSGVLK